MFSSITETISVAGVYNQAKFRPAKFRWRNRLYPVDEITFIHDLKDGGVKKRKFSVMSQGNLYRLCFDRDQETWLLEAVWCE